MNILLGLTGSVASSLYLKLIEKLNTIGSVDVIVTENAKKFIDMKELEQYHKSKASYSWEDADEWVVEDTYSGPNNPWMVGDPILHIEMRKCSSALVIAPCSANTLAKLANGICDNLLTSVARAWDMSRPIFVCPAMNTHMWEHPITQEHIAKLEKYGYTIVKPQSKVLACGDEGMGALADIDEIVGKVKNALTWKFPLKVCSGIPVTPHPGSFLAVRKDNHIHTGVDLYTDEGAEITACEAGRVVSIEPFTGVKDNSPWWKDTDAILIEGASGVICYGELEPSSSLVVGSRVLAGQVIGKVKRVIMEGKERFEITGWKPCMLHLELLSHGVTKASDGYIPRSTLRDPTPNLLKSSPPFLNHAVLTQLTWEPPK